MFSGEADVTEDAEAGILDRVAAALRRTLPAVYSMPGATVLKTPDEIVQREMKRVVDAYDRLHDHREEPGR